MVTNLYEEILDWAVRYLSGEVTLDQFEEWLIPNTWDVESSGDEASQALVHDILSMMVELSSGDLEQDEFDNELRKTVFNIHLSYPPVTGFAIHTYSTAETIPERFRIVPTQSWSVVDDRPERSGIRVSNWSSLSSTSVPVLFESEDRGVNFTGPVSS